MDQKEFIQMLYPNHPDPYHCHCGRPMVKRIDGSYYCRHCEELAKLEADPTTYEYHLKKNMNRSRP